jgi:hypothetical protein
LLDIGTFTAGVDRDLKGYNSGRSCRCDEGEFEGLTCCPGEACYCEAEGICRYSDDRGLKRIGHLMVSRWMNLPCLRMICGVQRSRVDFIPFRTGGNMSLQHLLCGLCFDGYRRIRALVDMSKHLIS